MIDDHDYDVKMRSMQRFFEEGDKVKVTLRFRGREMAHQELGYKLLDRVKGDIGKIAKIEQEPRFEGRQVVDGSGAALAAPDFFSYPYDDVAARAASAARRFSRSHSCLLPVSAAALSKAARASW